MSILIGVSYKTCSLLLLLFIVDATSTNTNETSKEHRQSRVTGRIVKLYSGTRPDPVSCAGEGFQADPHNCAVFYRCMKSGNGKYTVFKFQCGPGTVYDPETEVCNHPQSTKRSECGGIVPPPIDDRISNNEIEDIRQEVPSPITSIPNYTNIPETEKTTFAHTFTTTGSPLTISISTNRPILPFSTVLTSLNPGESSLGVTNLDHTINPFNLTPTTVSQNQQYNEGHKNIVPPYISQASKQDNICTSDGFMGDSENCRKFYRCVANQRGTYTRYEFSCSESTIWDDDSQSCNHAWAVKRSRCGRSGQQSNQITNKSTTPTAEGAEAEQQSLKDKTIQQQLQISYGSKVTQTQTQISNESVVQNQTQINYGDRTSPKKSTRAKQNQTQISHGSAISQSQTQIDYSDKGIQTQLQIDHSQQSSQSQIQIHETTTRGTSTSVAQVNTQQRNECNRSGFMGDSNDCKKFYRCIDNGRGSYIKFEFSCGEGTVWDQSIEACNHAWAVKECGGKGSSGSTSATHSSTSTLKTTQNYYTTVSTENYQTTSVIVATEGNEDVGYGQPNQNPTTLVSTTAGPTTTASHVTTTTPSKGECQSSGFIGDPNDCKVFYRCVENGKGAFTKYEFKCGEGTVWDPDLEACNHAWAVKKCGGNVSPDKVEATTEKRTTAYTDQTQSTVHIHPSTGAPATNNDDYDSGYESVNNVFTPTTTTTTRTPSVEQSSDTKCRSSGFIGDANDCKKFYRCVDNGNGGFTRYEFSCGEGTVWDSQTDACNHAWAVKNCGGTGSIDSLHETPTQTKPTTSHDIITSSSTESGQNNVSPTFIPSTTTITSSTSGSLPTASDDCTHSGFMGDKKDCKKFYRCVDNGNGSYTKYEFSCGEGTVWDQKIEACNHAWAVEKCGGSVESSSEHHETSTQHHNTISDESDNGYPSNQDIGHVSTQSTTTHVTTEGSKEPSNNNNCVNNGFIGDKNDCKKFYRCVDDGKNGFIRYEFSCGEGTLWDQSIEACNHAWAVKDCGQTGNNTQHISSESTTKVTPTSESEDQVYPQFTEKTTTTLMVSSYPDNQSGICLTEGFNGDKNDCKKFYRCVDNGRGGLTKYEFTCGDGTYWNQEILACDHTSSNRNCGGSGGGTSTLSSYEQDEMQTEATVVSSSSTAGNNNDYSTQKPVSSDVCTSEGFYGVLNDCKKFYRCVDNGKGSYTRYDFTCGDGTVWNQDIQACDHETNNKNCLYRPTSGSQTTASQSEAGNDFSVSPSTESQYSTEKPETSSTSSLSPSSSFNCESEGFFAHPNDCRKFIRCISNDKGGYTRYDFTCGEGTIWVQDILACDHDTGDSICMSQSTNKPVTTNEHQQTTEKHDLDATSKKPQTTDKQEDEYDTSSSNKPSQSGNDECSSEGFYANKNDCRQFYRCVDNGQGGYTKYDFTCGDGTAWDSEIQNCNHIEQVKACQGASSQPVMHEENNAQTTESTITTKTTTAESSHGSANENYKNTCGSEGYFGDKQDCKKFYRCVDNGKGGYTKYEYTCGEGTIWDQDITTCNHPQDVVNPSCKQQDGSMTSTTTSSSVSGEPSEAATSTESASSTQSTSSTQSSANCTQEDGTKKPENQNITCTQAGYFANPNDCKKFYRCVDWDGDGKRFSVYHFDCGEGTIWDPAVETCNHEESVYPPRDCSGSQSQSETQSPATEQTTTTQQESTSTVKSSTTEASTAQTTQSTASEPSTTEQSTTSQQTTTQQSSTSEQTTTQTSTTLEQTTSQPSTSKQTTTQQSTTSEQTTTQQSTTSEQTSQQSTTSEQTTQQSTTPEQTTQQSTTSQQTTTQQSTTSEQTTEQSTTSEQTTTQQSTTSEQTTTQQSTTSEQATTQESTTSEQTTQESSTSEQTTQESSTSEQTTQESSTSEQTTQESTTEQSTTQQSTTSDPTTTESTTTEQSTTQQSTTTEQSTTEESTTSEGTTTEESTTEQSTTEQTQDNSTTESSTGESESKCPETDADQNLFVCPTSFRRHPKYCNMFYQCDEEDDTHNVKVAVFTCPNNTIYDESQTRCVEEKKADKKCDGQIAQKRRFKRFDMDYKEPIVVTKDSHACKSAGYFSFEKDSECSPAFLKCTTNKNKKLRGLVYQCPSGYVYWSISKRCEPVNRVRDCKRSQNDWTGRWEIPVERRNVARS